MNAAALVRNIAVERYNVLRGIAVLDVPADQIPALIASCHSEWIAVDRGNGRGLFATYASFKGTVKPKAIDEKKGAEQIVQALS